MAPCPSSCGGIFTLGTAIILVICYLRAAVLDSNFKARLRSSGRAPEEHDVRVLECTRGRSLSAAAAAAAAAASTIKVLVLTAGWSL